ncbi:hypothetical protein NUW58_g6271 [Xylaria curta]|uniref:Uncharacterized protein n=1 Tax=Xylaria curta TaxID=42375 RepID=A0ACC1NW08_9PEZI|nr:hypothetical protein NUW58_g6271 [Xylaria curta]
MSRIALFHNLKIATTNPAQQSLRSVSHLTNIHTLIHSQLSSLTPNQKKQNRAPAPETQDQGDVYVLTLQTDVVHQARMSELRTQYFPAHLLKVNAHITLFHALPSSLLSIVIADLPSLSYSIPPFHIRAEAPFRMARGIGVHVSGLGPLKKLFAQLQGRWWGYLTPQDRRRFKGHYTLMNKVDDRDAREMCLGELGREFTGCDGVASGLCLSRYDRGWWRYERNFRFSGVSAC